MKYLFLFLHLIAIIVVIVAKKNVTTIKPTITKPTNKSLINKSFLDDTISVDEDAILSTPQIIRKNGYPVEVHHVLTEDGYILEVHRIPYGIRSDHSRNKVVYLQHGMLASSSCFILGGPDNSLAFILADNGYDVWMGNVRGNRYSRNHTTLDPDIDAEYWDFSWHEIGIYDVPTTIDYILKKTNHSQLFYIGHSMGTTVFFIMMSEYPQYDNKTIAAFLMAPVAYMNHLVSPLARAIAIWEKPLGQLLEITGMDEFLPSSKLYTIAGDLFCKHDEVTAPLCSNSIFMMVGFNPRELNESLIPIYSGHFPAGGSTKTILHYGQEIVSGHFRQYDKGILGNLLKYRSLKPPDYNLEVITTPVYLIYSHNDWFSSETDVLRLDTKLENSQLILVDDPLFNHMDYLIGINAPELVYSKILNIMDLYSEDQ